MKRNKTRLQALPIWALLLTMTLLPALLPSCAPKTQETAEEETTPEPEGPADMTEEAELWADSICDGMSLEEKLAQMVMPAVYAASDSVSLERLRWYAEDLKVGGILLLKGDAGSASVMADTLDAIRDRVPYSPGSFLAVDAETGLGMRFSDAPLFPWNSEVDRSVGDQTFFEYGQEVGREARITGINMVLGPVVDVDRDERKGGSVMKRRSLGSDQLRVAELSLAYARGLESQGVASVVKHFPGHGPTSSDSHEVMPKITTPRDELYAIDLMPFRTVVQNGLSCIMVGHIWAEALDSVKRPASFSPVVINDLLRGEMGFKGLVLVDAVGMGGARGYTGADAIAAGADLIIAPPDTEKELAGLLKAVEEGKLTQETVDESVKRILFYKYLRFVNSRQRNTQGQPAANIEERLHKEAPKVIDRLNGE